jgi:hypothetical protein
LCYVIRFVYLDFDSSTVLVYTHGKPGDSVRVRAVRRPNQPQIMRCCRAYIAVPNAVVGQAWSAFGNSVAMTVQVQERPMVLVATSTADRTLALRRGHVPESCYDALGA